MKTRYLSGSGREREGSLKGHSLAGEELMGLGLGKMPAQSHKLTVMKLFSQQDCPVQCPLPCAVDSMSVNSMACCCSCLVVIEYKHPFSSVSMVHGGCCPFSTRGHAEAPAVETLLFCLCLYCPYFQKVGSSPRFICGLRVNSCSHLYCELKDSGP